MQDNYASCLSSVDYLRNYFSKLPTKRQIIWIVNRSDVRSSLILCPNCWPKLSAVVKSHPYPEKINPLETNVDDMLRFNFLHAVKFYPFCHPLIFSISKSMLVTSLSSVDNLYNEFGSRSWSTKRLRLEPNRLTVLWYFLNIKQRE